MAGFTERPDFLLAYREVPTPQTLFLKDAVEWRALQTRDIFFQAVFDSLDVSYRTLQDFFEISPKEPIAEVRPDEQASEHFILDTTGGYAQHVRQKGHQALASFQFVEHKIALFTKTAVEDLLPETVQSIRDLQTLEGIEFGLN